MYQCRYPPSVYPVLAMRGAPASFPIRSEHRHLQRYLMFSRRVDDEAQQYIDKHFPQKKFVGIHLRNGADWVSLLLHHMSWHAVVNLSYSFVIELYVCDVLWRLGFSQLTWQSIRIDSLVFDISICEDSTTNY